MNQTQNKFIVQKDEDKEKDRVQLNPIRFNKSKTKFFISPNKDNSLPKEPTIPIIKGFGKPHVGRDLLNKVKLCKMCNLCGQDIMKNLIYENQACGHSYCYYCLLDLKDTHAGV